MDWHRRRVLRLVGASGLAALAGCSSSDGEDTDTQTKPQSPRQTAASPTEDPEAPTRTPTDTATTVRDTETPAPIGESPLLQTKLAADDGDSEDKFGLTVALSGDGTTALIGASFDEDPRRGGSAYVFQQSGGTWTQQAKLAADDGDTADRFGSSVALSGDGTTALIGALGHNNSNGERAGSAYVFK